MNNVNKCMNDFDKKCSTAIHDCLDDSVCKIVYNNINKCTPKTLKKMADDNCAANAILNPFIHGHPSTALYEYTKNCANFPQSGVQGFDLSKHPNPLKCLYEQPAAPSSPTPNPT